MGEHVVLFDRPASRYPYAPDGAFAVAGDVEWMGPTYGQAVPAPLSGFVAHVRRCCASATVSPGPS